MARREYKGAAAKTRLSSGINAAATSFDIDSAAGWPSGGANGPFIVTLDPDTSTEERILVGSRTTNTLNSITRGYDDTSAVAHSAGADGTVIHSSSAVDHNEANQHINDATLDHHTQYMRADGTRHDLAARHTFTGLGWAPPTPTALTPDIAGAAGSSAVPSRGDHVHNVPAATATSVTGTLAEGVAATFARSDHNHTISGANHIPIAAIANASIGNGVAALAAEQSLWHVAAANPGAIGANRIWFNTTKRTILIRNAGNTDWEVVMCLGPGITYTPTLTGITLSDGLNYARKRRMGRQVIVDGYVKLGTAGNVTGRIGVGLPNSAADLDAEYSGEFFFHGAARGSDISAIKSYAAVGVVSVGTELQDLLKMDFIATAGVFAWDAVTPFGWDPGDRFSYFIEYETATAVDADFT